MYLKEYDLMGDLWLLWNAWSTLFGTQSKPTKCLLCRISCLKLCKHLYIMQSLSEFLKVYERGVREIWTHNASWCLDKGNRDEQGVVGCRDHLALANLDILEFEQHVCLS